MVCVQKNIWPVKDLEVLEVIICCHLNLLYTFYNLVYAWPLLITSLHPPFNLTCSNIRLGGRTGRMTPHLKSGQVHF